MTKYILAGGNDRLYDKFASDLKEELSGLEEPISILSCFFAKDQDMWLESAQEWESWFRRYLGEINYSVMLMEGAEKEISMADIIFFHGGDNDALIERMQQHPGIQEGFKHKIIVGSSAGANYLSQNFWTRSKQEIGRGAGTLPVNVIVHYDARTKEGKLRGTVSEWSKAKRAMEAISTEANLLCLREGQIEVVEL